MEDNKDVTDTTGTLLIMGLLESGLTLKLKNKDWKNIEQYSLSSKQYGSVMDERTMIRELQPKSYVGAGVSV